VSPFHTGSIRAHRIASNTRLLGLDGEQIETALAASGTAELVRIVAAGSQTDFVPARIDKALGLRRLGEELGEESSERPLALAVGDALEDLPMLALAELPVVPANAEHALSERLDEVSGRQSRKLCQAGLLDAVGQLLGHDPLGCSVCRSPLPVDADEELLQTILGALDGGRRRKLRQATRLASQVRRTPARTGRHRPDRSGAGRGVTA